MLSLNSVSICYDKLCLINDLSVSFLPTAIVYLCGKNGSGKSSLLQTIAGIKKPSKGSITFGKNNTPIEFLPKPYCSYLGHNNAVKAELTVEENISFWAKFYDSAEMIAPAIFYFGLESLSSKRCFELSAGQRQKVALARLMACQSPLWLLDEVETNLDSENTSLFNQLVISKADSGGIIILATHHEQKIKSAISINIDEYAHRSA